MLWSVSCTLSSWYSGKCTRKWKWSSNTGLFLFHTCQPPETHDGPKKSRKPAKWASPTRQHATRTHHTKYRRITCNSPYCVSTASKQTNILGAKEQGVPRVSSSSACRGQTACGQWEEKIRDRLHPDVLPPSCVQFSIPNIMWFSRGGGHSIGGRQWLERQGARDLGVWLAEVGAPVNVRYVGGPHHVHEQHAHRPRGRSLCTVLRNPGFQALALSRVYVIWGLQGSSQRCKS